MIPTEVRIFNKAIAPGETTELGPALAVHNDRLWLAWVGRSNQQLNVMSATVNGLGSIVFDRATKQTMGDTSDFSPALASFNGRLWIAWTGVDNHQLNVMGSVNGNDFDSTTKQVMGDTSDAGPALAVFDGRLWIAWMGVSNHQLNVMASRNGNDFDFTTKQVMGDTSDRDPALAALGDRLWISWTGADDEFRLNFMSSRHGNDFDSTTKSILFSVGFNPPGPSLTSLHQRLWTSTSSPEDRIAPLALVQSQILNGLAVPHRIGPILADKTNVALNSGGRQSLAVFGGRLFIAWMGIEDHPQLNVGMTDISHFAI